MRWFKYLLLILSLLFYIYNVQLQVIPIAPKTLLAVPGFLLLIIDITRIDTRVFNKYFRLFGIVLILFFWGIITMVINGSSEMLYFAYIKYFFLWFFAVYFICYLGKDLINSFLDLCKVITWVVVFESIIAFLIKFNPGVAQIVNSIQEMEVYRVGIDYYLDTSDLTDFMRIIGLGNAFYFGVLTSCTIGLISCAYVISFNKQKVLYIISYIIIAAVSIMTTRTSLVSIAFGLVLVMYYKMKNNKFSFITTSVTVLLAVFALYSLAISFLPENMLEWQMELFGKGGGKSNEALTVKQWLLNTDFDFKTLLIGDAHYKMGDYSYYKNVDVGFYRQIYYSGIIGLAIILFYNLKILKYSKQNSSQKDNVGAFVNVLYVCYLLFMLKGDINFVELYLMVLMMLDFCVKRKYLAK